jgi:hypothetical protein
MQYGIKASISGNATNTKKKRRETVATAMKIDERNICFWIIMSVEQ